MGGRGESVNCTSHKQPQSKLLRGGTEAPSEGQNINVQQRDKIHELEGRKPMYRVEISKSEELGLNKESHKPATLAGVVCLG